MVLFAVVLAATARTAAEDSAGDFANPSFSARPWVYWYWMQANATRDGITKDLEAMAQSGIGGAYLMPIGATSSAISRFLFEGGFSFRVPLFASGYLHFVPVPLRSGWLQNDRHSLAGTDLCLNYFPLRSPNFHRGQDV